MPKLRRLSGKDVIKILQELGFEIYSQKGSHIKLRRFVNEQEQRLLVPVHGSKTIKLGTLKSIYRDVLDFIAEEELLPYFFTQD